MSSIFPPRRVCAYHYAADLPKEAWRALRQHEATANIILPFLLKASKFSRENGSISKQLWIVLYDDTNNVEFVLSCTEGPQGKYPVFIVTCKTKAQLAAEEAHGRHLADAMLLLVRCLLEHVPPQRVFSVFAITKVTETFAKVFEAQVREEDGIRAYKKPYYDATLTFCTRETLKKPSDAVSSFPGPESVVISLCLADMSHLKGIKTLCKQFSETSWPFVLDDARAEQEARLLITNRQVWVHLIQKAEQEPEIACLVATTRESDNVTAVTKVFTAKHWRGRGCAARLMHRVCHDILQEKQRTVLYVGNSDDLAPARKVYHKIGFQGLNASQGQQTVEGVEKWLEIGFKGTTLGYW